MNVCFLVFQRGRLQRQKDHPNQHGSQFWKKKTTPVCWVLLGFKLPSSIIIMAFDGSPYYPTSNIWWDMNKIWSIDCFFWASWGQLLYFFTKHDALFGCVGIQGQKGDRFPECFRFASKWWRGWGDKLLNPKICSLFFRQSLESSWCVFEGLEFELFVFYLFKLCGIMVCGFNGHWTNRLVFVLAMMLRFSWHSCHPRHDECHNL